jgi:hypothetical protein
MASKLEGDDRKKRLQCYASRGPGPATVLLPPTMGMINHDKTRTQAPAYSLGLKLRSSLIANTRTPGPSYLIPQGMTSKGPGGAPAYTLRPRTKIFGLGSVGPGPAAYNPEINVNRTKPPAYSLRSRTKIIERGHASPGPIYLLPSAIGPKVPDKPAAAECSLKGKGKPPKSMTGGAGFYDIGRPDLVKNRAGEVSLKSRQKERFNTYPAGPATYNLQNAVNKVRPTPPAFSLGIRHTECAGIYFTKLDKADSENCGCGEPKASSNNNNNCPC